MGLKILKATYGVQGNFTDVTSEIKAMVNDDSLDFTVSAQSLGILDPAPGVKKTFQAKVVINDGHPTIMTKEDGEQFTISATETSRRRGPTASQLTFMGVVFKNILVFLTWFFIAFGFLASYKVGAHLFGNVFGYIFGIFGLIGYILQLHIIFFWRLFRSEDFNFPVANVVQKLAIPDIIQKV